jgi:hypothetical protein
VDDHNKSLRPKLDALDAGASDAGAAAILIAVEGKDVDAVGPHLARADIEAVVARVAESNGLGEGAVLTGVGEDRQRGRGRGAGDSESVVGHDLPQMVVLSLSLEQADNQQLRRADPG